MGCWGMGLMQSDEFCEVYDRFMESYDEGVPVQEITEGILREYRSEFDDEDGILHDVYFALAKAEWMSGEQSSAILSRTKQIIDDGLNLEFYAELGAKDADLKIRKKNLDKFLLSLQTPRATPRKRKPKPKPLYADAKKGMVFWYRSKGAVYGALVLEVLTRNSILVALSEKLDGEPKTVEHVMNAGVYTAAWFAALLPSKRVHKIGMVSVPESYNGRAGVYHTEDVHFCENVGLDSQWNHEKCALCLPNLKICDLLIAENLPSTFRNQDRLDAILQSKRRLEWISAE